MEAQLNFVAKIKLFFQKPLVRNILLGLTLLIVVGYDLYIFTYQIPTMLLHQKNVEYLYQNCPLYKSVGNGLYEVNTNPLFNDSNFTVR